MNDTDMNVYIENSEPLRLIEVRGKKYSVIISDFSGAYYFLCYATSTTEIKGFTGLTEHDVIKQFKKYIKDLENGRIK